MTLISAENRITAMRELQRRRELQAQRDDRRDADRDREKGDPFDLFAKEITRHRD